MTEVEPAKELSESQNFRGIQQKVDEFSEFIDAAAKTENSLNLRIASLEAQLAAANNDHSKSEKTLAETLDNNAKNENSLNLKITSLEAQLADSLNKIATVENSLSETKEINEKESNGLNLKITSLDAQLAESKNETTVEKSKLEAHKLESSSTLLATEEEILSLRKQLADSKLMLGETQTRLDAVGDYDIQILKLKKEVRLLTLEKSDLIGRINDLEPLYPLRRSYLPLYPRDPSPIRYRSPSPTRANITNDIRANRLITRYSTLFTHDRLSVADTLRRYVDEEEMVRRIIFIAATEAFHSAKLAFRAFESRTRKLLLPIHSGPETLDEAVADYIVRNLDLFDVEKCVREVVRQMDGNPIISYPAECDFTLLNSFIREVSKVAFEMQAVEPKINIAHSIDGELFNDKKYRRSYDSEYSAPLVCYYIWPSLMDGANCVAKGEAYTKRGALSHSPRRSRSPSPRRRGRSPIRRKY